MPLSLYYGILMVGVLLTLASAARNMGAGRGLVAFASDLLYIVLFIPVLLIAARQFVT